MVYLFKKKTKTHIPDRQYPVNTDSKLEAMVSKEEKRPHDNTLEHHHVIMSKCDLPSNAQLQLNRLPNGMLPTKGFKK